ncbi:MAG TPA: hypothetical protein DCR65_10865 [Gammaproteobacteria bacterium]|jgi:hypothetical protein|nr:hypothetical protein [Gammaproteobacteria bacterium]
MYALMLRKLGAWLLAVVVGYAVGTVAATQFVLAKLGELGVAVPIGDRLGTTVFDLAGMASSYLPLVAVALAIAFPVAALVVRFRPAWRAFGYPLAGAVALLVLHLALQLAIGFAPVAGVRTTAGLVVQMLAGALGGYVLLRALPAPR